MKWFVMLHGHRLGIPIPLTIEDNDSLEIRLFDTEDEALEAGRKTALGKHYGVEAYSWEP